VRYFKHYSNARRSESLSILIAEHGLEAYARYWILLEFLAEEFDGKTTSFRYHVSTVRELLRIQSWTKLQLVCNQLSTVRGIALRQIETVLEIDAPILLDLLNRDFKNARTERDQTAPKIKIKKKNKDKEGEVPATALPALALLWNDHSNKLPKVIASNDKRKKAADMRLKEYGEEKWISAIQRIANSDFCNGLNDKSWIATFDWILQPDVFLKITEGKYDNRPNLSKKQIQSAKNTKELIDWANDDSEGGLIEFKRSN
jgi:hypothetical protein